MFCTGLWTFQNRQHYQNGQLSQAYQQSAGHLLNEDFSTLPRTLLRLSAPLDHQEVHLLDVSSTASAASTTHRSGTWPNSVCSRLHQQTVPSIAQKQKTATEVVSQSATGMFWGSSPLSPPLPFPPLFSSAFPSLPSPFLPSNFLPLFASSLPFFYPNQLWVWESAVSSSSGAQSGQMHFVFLILGNHG